MEEALARLRAEPDPVRKLALLRELARTPGLDLQPICEGLGDPAIVEECNTKSRRPHLRRPPGRDRMITRLWGQRLPEQAVGPLADVAPALAPSCAERQPAGRDACQALHARTLAEEQGAREAAAACNALSEGADECLFRVAELRTGQHDAAGAVHLCLASHSWVEQCLTHFSRSISRPLVEISPTEIEAWQALAARIDAASEAAEAAGHGLATTLRAHIWAQAFGGSMLTYDGADGSLLQQLPAEALPQYRAVLAWRLTDGERDLAELTTEVLAGTEGPISLGVGAVIHPREGRGWSWSMLPAELNEIPTVSYLDARRVLAPEPEADAAICVLEAYNAHGNVPVPVLDAALSHPSALVRWTAARLLPPASAGEELRMRAYTDPDSLVQTRARQHGERGPGGPLPFKAELVPPAGDPRRRP